MTDAAALSSSVTHPTGAFPLKGRGGELQSMGGAAAPTSLYDELLRERLAAAHR